MATRWTFYTKELTDWGIAVPATRGTWTASAGGGSQSQMMGPDKADLGGAAGQTPTFSLPTGVGNNYWGFKLAGPRLAAQTITGTVDLVDKAFMLTSVDADPHYAIHIYVMAPDGSVRGTLLSNYADPHTSDEWTTTMTGRQIVQQTLTSVTTQDNDRIIVELGAIRRAGATARTWSLMFGGTGADQVQGSTTTGAPWIEFSQTLTLMPADARISQFAVEALVKPDLSIVNPRITQLPVEVMVGPNLAITRVSQLAVEVLIEAEDPTPPAAVGRSHIVIAG